MRHQTRGRKFHRIKGVRAALFKGLLYNAVMKERIETTEAKAKEIRPRLERLLTIGKKQTIAALRMLMARVPKQAAEKIYYDLAPRYKTRQGGYLRVIKRAAPRKGDGSKMATIEFV